MNGGVNETSVWGRFWIPACAEMTVVARQPSPVDAARGKRALFFKTRHNTDGKIRRLDGA
jgi:hypothetical protein